MPSQPKAVLYARVSTQDQEERNSIALQLDTAPRWSVQQGVELVETYVDEDASGTLMLAARPSGARLLHEAAELRKRGVSLILLYEWSRIGREPWVLWDAVYQLEKAHGFRIKSMTQDADTSTPEKILLLCLGSGIDSMERHKTLRRSRDAMELLAEKGAWLGGYPPFGYRLEGKGRDARLIYDTELIPGTDPALDLRPMALVLQIFQRSAEGQTNAAIATWLNGLGVPTTVFQMGREQSLGWRTSRVCHLLHNPIYKGERIWGRIKRPRSSRPHQAIAATCLAIVPPELWEAAQEGMRRNFAYASRNCKRQYLLRGMIRCEDCGRRYSGTTMMPQPGNVVFYYRCAGIHSDLPGTTAARCHAAVVPAEALESTVWERVATLIRDPGPALEQIARERRERRQQSDKLGTRLELLRTSLREREAQRAQCIGWARRGIISEADLERELTQIGREEQALQVELRRLEPEAIHEARLESELTEARRLLDELGHRLEANPSWERKREILERLVERVEVTTTGARRRKSIEARIIYRFSA